MSNEMLAIVAIPKNDSYIWRISSEKVPHVTLLFFGDQTENPNVNKIVDFVKHATETMLQPFWLDVERRGELGDAGADVLFLKDYSKQLEEFRATLLQNRYIREAYESVPQFEGWTPHLTLGYPETPAKEDEREYPNFHSIEFDVIAVWTDNFAGEEFILKAENREVVMSHILDEDVEFLAHYGVKGMKWGVRRDGDTRSVGARYKDAMKAKYARRKERRAEKFAKRREIYENIFKSSKREAQKLSEEELLSNIRRLRLEDEFVRLSAPRKSEGRKLVEEILRDTTKQYTTKLLGAGLNNATLMVFDKAANSAGISNTQRVFYESMAKRPKKG